MQALGVILVLAYSVGRAIVVVDLKTRLAWIADVTAHLFSW